MKKICNFILIFLAVFSCALFSACKDKYANLTMSFYSQTGNQIDSIEMLIDNANPEKSKDEVRLAVKFDGISADDIGNIVVSTEPQERATVSNYVYQNEYVFFNLTANMAGPGKIKVTHLSTGKTSECDLNIGQKSSNLNLTNSTYLLSIPESGSKEIEINANGLVKLTPASSTDKVYFKPVDGVTPPIGIDYVTEIVGGESLIKGFNFSSVVTDNTTLELYPVTTMEDYNNTEYKSCVVKFVFIHTLKNENITLKTDETHQANIDGDEPILLIANDNKNGLNAQYSYNNVKLNFYNNEDKVSESNIFNQFYEYELSANGTEVSVLEAGEEIVIVANSYSNRIITATLTIKPTAAGEAETITRTIRVKGEVKPKEIEVSMQGEKIDINSTVELFDYYLSSGSARGALFKFKPLEEYSYLPMQGMRICVEPEILNAYMGSAEGNCIYTNANFNEMVENVDSFGGKLARNNKYLLEFRIDNDFMKFYFDTNINRFVSEPINQYKNVYIKYVESEITQERYALAMDVMTFYDGDISYLQGITGVTETINFNRQDGVTRLILNAGTLYNSSKAIEGIIDDSGNDKIAEQVYLNRLKGTDTKVEDLKDQSSVLIVGENGVRGLNDKAITSSTFNVSVTGGKDNPLKIRQNVAGAISSNEIKFNFNAVQRDMDAIILDFNSNTDIGEYTITFKHANGFTHSVKCFVYQDLDKQDLNYVLETNEKAFSNYQNGECLFKDYSVDYIVASHQSLSVDILLDQVFIDSNIVEGYEFTFGADHMLGAESILDYIDITHEDGLNTASISFKKGSYKNNENCSFAIYLSVNIHNFIDILTIDGTKVETIYFSVFIYDEIQAEDVSILGSTGSADLDKVSSVTLYWEDKLGAYDKDLSKQNLEISIVNEDLWNYVQSATQTEETASESYNIGATGKKVAWFASSNRATNYIEVQPGSQGENNISLNAHSGQNANEEFVLTAMFTQFKQKFSFQVRFRVLSPVITERVSVEGVKTYNDGREEHYINLKAGETYTINYKNISPKGEVTNPGVVLAVSDRYGNSNYNSVSVDGNTLTVRSNIASTELKLYIFARDALAEIIYPTTQGFNDPSSFLIFGKDLDLEAYKNAYMVVDLLLSNGDENNPYLIESADDFWEINASSLNKTKNYKLMTNIDLSDTTYTGEKVIRDFSGKIFTYSYKDGEEWVSMQYTLFGLTLDNTHQNLFENFSGTMENVLFNVTYNYKLETSLGSTNYFGVFKNLIVTGEGPTKKVGTLNNVAVNVSGQAELTGRGIVYFGGLVGENNGKISYTSSSVVGTSGNLTLNGDAKVVYGGLVGLNNGQIEGYSLSEQTTTDTTQATTDSTENNIVFGVMLTNQGVLGNVDISSTLSNQDSAIGGIVGENNLTTDKISTMSANEIYSIKNAYVTGKIDAESTSNVGGVVGKNTSPVIEVTIELGGIDKQDLVGVTKAKNYSHIQNIKSNVKIKANNNVGGIVGLDNGGSYLNCHYQILSGNTQFILGNERVGGIAGSTKNGWFVECSVMSYRLNYNDLVTYFNTERTADIQGETYVGGIIGLTENDYLSMPTDPNIKEFNATTTVIQKSSVNAYVKSNADVGGLLSMSNDLPDQISLVTDAYFFGKLEGDFSHFNGDDYADESTQMLEGVVLGNNQNYFFTRVYSINVVKYDNDVLQKEVRVLPNGFTITLPESTTGGVDSLNPGWGYIKDQNGGYVFISKYGEEGERLNQPIFDLMPSSIEYQIVKGYQLMDGETPVNGVVHFDYYSFRLDPSAEDYIETQNRLNEKFNTHSVVGSNGFLKLSATPTGIGDVRLYLESSNTNVFSVADDKVVIRGVGRAYLYIRSLLNNSVYAVLEIDVSYPVGKDFNLSLSADGETSPNTIEIAKYGAKQLFINTTGSEALGDRNFEYVTNSRISLEITVEALSDRISTNEINPFDYLSVSGIVPETGKNMVVLDHNTPFSISVKDYIKDVKFKFTIKPYTEIEYNGTTLKQYIKIEDNISFEVSTFVGATDLALNFNSAVFYPNDSTIITAFIKTDIELKEDETTKQLSTLPTCVDVTYTDKTGAERLLSYTGNDVSKFVQYLSERHGEVAYSGGLQTEFYRIVFNEEELLKEENNLSLAYPIHIRVLFTLINGETASVNFTVLPQRIQKVEIKNYTYEDQDNRNVIKQTDIMRPLGEGLIIVDLAPTNGYYDYMEIADITGMEEITFAQIDGVGGSLLSIMDSPSSDGKGIKLVKQLDENRNQKELYVATRISNMYSSRKHTISVRAYLNDGTLLSENKFVVDVRMLPSISVEYRNPNNEIIASATETKKNTTAQPIALGVDALLRVQTYNADGDVSYEIEFADKIDDKKATDYFNLVEGERGFYYLTFKQTEGLLGREIKVTVSTKATNENGNFETAEASMNFVVRPYVVHSATVNPSRTIYSTNRNETKREIYGHYGVLVDLEVYFTANDISALDPNESSIQNILSTLNNGLSNYLTFENLELATGETVNDYYTFENSQLLVNKLWKDAKAVLEFRLILDTANNVWRVEREDEHDIADETLTSNEIIFKRIRQEYSLNFSNVSSYYEPEIIKDEQDFLNMQAGDEANYLLSKNLVLENYSPVDVDIKSFDGNGHTITIKSFAPFVDAEIQAGLFKHIYPDMLVANVKVIYPDGAFGRVHNVGASTFNITEYYDLCNNPDVDFSSASFGGITPQNEGIITNCVVEGTVALRASVVESKISSGDYSIDFNIGGLVTENTQSGRITHSHVELRIFAQANIGGFAHSNVGKIASSSFAGNGTIYAYNDLNNTIVSNVAGFVVENSGEISMSYVRVGTTNIRSGQALTSPVNNVIGNMSAKDVSAGFVYRNTSKIYDCFATLDKIGENNNTFYGFVADNSGTIENDYTYINKGVKPTTEVIMFAPVGSTGITNCVEIVAPPAGYNNRVDGLEIIEAQNRTIKAEYEKWKFTFGDNVSAVWTISQGEYELPTLVSAEDKYVGWGTSMRGITETRVLNETTNTFEIKYSVNSNSLGTKQNPYLIFDVESWQNNFNVKDENEQLLPLNYYYRIIADIEFNSQSTQTSTRVFSGNIQGNNMVVSGIMLYSAEELPSLGVFGSLVGSNNRAVTNAVRNITLQVNSIQSTKTVAVGTLAGIVQDFNLYNIHVDAPNVILVGKNAVGGIAGIVRGNFDMQRLSSNVGANSTRAQQINTYNAYKSKNNGTGIEVAENLADVFYAGGLFGIVDGYNNASMIGEDRNITEQTYFHINEAVVDGSIVAIGENAGAMFGLVGERVMVKDAIINLTGGKIYGTEYSSLAVAENRGVLDGFKVSCSADMFTDSRTTIAGLVGLNLGGLVQNSTVKANIVCDVTNSVAGGIVGRNVGGTVANNTFDGNISAYFAGGIIGTDYTFNTFLGVDTGRTGTNALNSSCLEVVNMYKKGDSYKTITYSYNHLNEGEEGGEYVTEKITNSNNILTNATLKNLFENMSSFYSYDSNKNSFKEAIVYKRVLGLYVGAADRTDIVKNYGLDNDNNLVFNGKYDSAVGTITEAKLIGDVYENTDLEKPYELPYVNIAVFGGAYDYVTYITGVKVGAFDTWNRREYSTEMLVFATSSVSNPLPITGLKNGTTAVKYYITKAQDDNFNLRAVGDYTSLTLGVDLTSYLSSYTNYSLYKESEVDDNKIDNLSFDLNFTTSGQKKISSQKKILVVSNVKDENNDSVVLKTLTFQLDIIK